MHFFLLLCCFYCCISCQEAASSSAIVKAKPLPVAEESISELGEILLQSQQISHRKTLADLHFQSLPKLPGDSSYFSRLQVSALQIGSRKSLRKAYQRIITPSRVNAFEKTKFLDLSGQNIHFIPNRVARYSNIQYLSLQHNRIEAINPLLAQCRALKTLDLSSNGMQKLPHGMHYVKQVKNLVLADNKLTSLPSSLSSLSNLTVIDISNLHTQMAEFYNDIRQVPKVLLNMPHLEKLFLEKLPLKRLPKGLHKITNLHVLSINGNREMNLNQTFQTLSKCPNLIALDISFIGRRTLPKSISKLQQLKVLVWHEENRVNQAYIESTLKELLPNTRIYFGKKGVATPFLRGNSLTTLEGAGK